jgi:hypothetical protein
MGGMKAAACLQTYYEDQVIEEAMQLHNAYGLLSSMRYYYFSVSFSLHT